jgi:transposase
MATAHMPKDFFDAVAHHLPPESPVGPKGGRPRVGHYTVIRVLWFVPTTGARWEDVPPELGCSGRTAHRRLRAWEEAGILGRLKADLPGLLKRADKLDLDTAIIDGVTVRAFGGGEATGPSPVGRRKPGTKHTVMVNKAGVPPVIRTAGANASDHRQILPVVLDFPRVGGAPGRPKELPDDLYADRGYDSEATRGLLRWLGIEPHIARRRTPHGSGLGKVRWVVERTIAWIKGLRRMRVRYDRLGVVMEAWATLAACVICFRILHHDAM